MLTSIRSSMPSAETSLRIKSDSDRLAHPTRGIMSAVARGLRSEHMVAAFRGTARHFFL